MKIRVLNRRTCAPKERSRGEYVGRPTILGNPYRIGVDGGREEVIALYRVWLHRMMDMRDEAVLGELKRLRELAKRPEGLILLCWCKPEKCHADVIKKVLESME